jgi:hypothetical protein
MRWAVAQAGVRHIARERPAELAPTRRRVELRVSQRTSSVKRSRKMTQPTSKLNSESRILWSEGSFETTIFASGLRRRRFSVRRPAQAPNDSQRI